MWKWGEHVAQLVQFLTKLRCQALMGKILCLHVLGANYLLLPATLPPLRGLRTEKGTPPRASLPPALARPAATALPPPLCSSSLGRCHPRALAYNARAQPAASSTAPAAPPAK